MGFEGSSRDEPKATICITEKEVAIATVIRCITGIGPMRLQNICCCITVQFLDFLIFGTVLDCYFLNC